MGIRGARGDCGGGKVVVRKRGWSGREEIGRGKENWRSGKRGKGMEEREE